LTWVFFIKINILKSLAKTQRRQENQKTSKSLKFFATLRLGENNFFKTISTFTDQVNKINLLANLES